MPTRVAKVSVATYVFSGKPGEEYIVTARDRLRVDQAEAYTQLRFNDPVPFGEVAVAATLEMTFEDVLPGTRTVSVQRTDAPGRPYKEINWNNRPLPASGSVAVPVGPQAGTNRKFQFNVLPDVLLGLARLDLRVFTDDTTSRWFKGPRATNGYPRLVVQTEVVPEAPVDVTPQGVIGSHAPVVQWTAQEGTDQVQVQLGTVDIDGDWATTLFDSGALSKDYGYVSLPALLGDPDVELVPNGTFETNTTGWTGSSATLARVTTQFFAGVAAMSLTATAATTISASTATGIGPIPVKGNDQFVAQARFRANTTARNCSVAVQWYDAAGASISTSTAATVADVNSGWTLVSGTVTAPATAAYGRIILTVASAASGEIHYVDAVSLKPQLALANGQTKAIRARHHVPAGWSAYSEPNEVTRTAWPTLTITNPGATTADATPPVQWTFAGQKAWQVIVDNSDEGEVGNSKKRPGTDNSWTAPDAGGDTGETFTYTVRAWDGIDRADRPYAEAKVASVYTPTASVAPTTGVTVTQVGTSPAVQIAWTRSSGTPDEVIFTVDGVRMHTQDGVDGPWTCYTADPNVSHVYGVIARVNNQNSNSMATATFKAKVTGLWLLDDQTGRGFSLRGQDLEYTFGEVATVHTPMRATELIRRVTALRGAEGTFKGKLDPRDGRTLAQLVADIWWMKEQPHRKWRLIVGDMNIPVRVGELFPTLHPDWTVNRMVKSGSFTFGQSGELPFTAL